MKSKILPKWSLIIFGIVGIVVLATAFFILLRDQDFRTEPSLSKNSRTSQDFGQTKLDIPIRLVIPEIKVDAAIEDVGFTSQGAMAVPAGPNDVAWFDLGPRPGEDGSAVIAGHEGWKDGIAAVFDDLYKLQKGDKIYVENEQGASTTFIVNGIQTYDQNGDASDIFSSSDGKAHLNLITCEGTWNAAEKSYSNRLVVFTDKE